ncbi:MAG: hypothetical protein ACJ79A_12950 [Gemmatimonadaceae bacterium]
MLLCCIAPVVTAQPADRAAEPWHLGASQLAVVCRGAVTDMRAAVDAALRRPMGIGATGTSKPTP